MLITFGLLSTSVSAMSGMVLILSVSGKLARCGRGMEWDRPGEAGGAAVAWLNQARFRMFLRLRAARFIWATVTVRRLSPPFPVLRGLPP